MSTKIMVPSFQNFQQFFDQKKKNTAKFPAYPDMNFEDPYIEDISLPVKKGRECILTQANMRWKIEVLLKRVVNQNEVELKPGYKSEYKWKYDPKHISLVEYKSLKKLKLLDHINFRKGLTEGTIYPELTEKGKMLQIRRSKESAATKNTITPKTKVYLDSPKIQKALPSVSKNQVTSQQDKLGKLGAGESIQYSKTTFPIQKYVFEPSKPQKRARETETPILDTTVEKKLKISIKKNQLESNNTIVINSMDSSSITNRNEIMRAIWDGEDGVKNLVETVVRRETRKLQQSLTDLKEEIKTLKSELALNKESELTEELMERLLEL